MIRVIRLFSYEAIYQYIYSPSGKALKLYKFLRRKRSFRYPKGKRFRQISRQDKVSIHERPIGVNDRSSFGHWEGDLILFYKTRTNMITLRERKTRYLVGLKNSSRRAKDTSKTLIKHMKKKGYTVDTLTLDNGPEFSGYREMSCELGADIYFCDPYKSYQKGAIENGNRLLRQILPKKFSIDSIQQKRISEVVTMVNNRPMKILGFRTPLEEFLRETEKRVNV